MSASSNKRSGRTPHHLSQKASGSAFAPDGELVERHGGWLGCVTSLEESSPATNLLADTAPATSRAHTQREMAGGTATQVGTAGQEVAATGAATAPRPSNGTTPGEGRGESGAEEGGAGGEESWVGRGTSLPGGPDDFQSLLSHAVHALEVEVLKVGEAVVELGSGGGYGPQGLTETALEEVVTAVTAHMDGVDADVSVLRRRKVPAPTLGAPDSWVADVAIRLRAGVRSSLEVRVAIIGNVDSGKSTMVGVLTRSMLDDGRGLARSKVFKHNHEESTGRTSSIGQHNLCLSSKGDILNDPSFKTLGCADYVAKASKVVTLVDLAGHEKYFKTTAYGLTGHMPDYACLIVGANAGIVGMCKEHLGVALALKVPVFFVITKVDICPEHILKHSLHSLQTILKKPGVKKKPFLVRTRDDVVTCARHIHSESLAPIFLTSSVTGQGLDLIRLFYSLLPQRHKWYERLGEAAEFIIDETFGVPGVGTVVAGTVKRGVISPSTPLLLGPDPGTGAFKQAAVKSIHYKRLPVGKVVAGQTAALALKKVKRSAVRKGMVLVDERVKPAASWEFDADIAILTHATTIQPKYQAVIHCEIVRQAAQVIAMDSERLRSGDRACVRFRFLQRPEYLTPGQRFVFREGRTKGIGLVVATEMGGV